MLSNGLKLLKLVWHPVDLDGDRVLPTAFRKEDISGGPGQHVSVDRSDLAERASMEAVANEQYAKSLRAKAIDGRDLGREEAKIGLLLCGDVRRQHINGDAAFEVQPLPIEGNTAHCGIENISGIRDPKSRKDRSFYDEARTKLADVTSPAITFDEVYPK